MNQKLNPSPAVFEVKVANRLNKHHMNGVGVNPIRLMSAFQFTLLNIIVSIKTLSLNAFSYFSACCDLFHVLIML